MVHLSIIKKIVNTLNRYNFVKENRFNFKIMKLFFSKMLLHDVAVGKIGILLFSKRTRSERKIFFTIEISFLQRAFDYNDIQS